MKKIIYFSFILLISFASSTISRAQLPNPVLVGYFHNWSDFNAPYIQLNTIDSRYNVIDIAFAVPQSGSDYNMTFVPENVTQATFISQIQAMQNLGKKLIISIGGASAPVSLDDTIERNMFISSMTAIINTYGFDGIDIDLEGSSVSVSGGTIATPLDAKIINMIAAIKQIMSNYRLQNNKKLLLTMAPETAYVQGGQSAYGGIWGAYLPIIHALRDSLDLLHVQLYNSGSMYGIDASIYNQGTADFIVSMTEAVIHGFNTSGGYFTGIPANKIAVALPACVSAGSGYIAPLTVKSAIDYLRGVGSKPGTYTLAQAGGYPDLRGMMTWSVNWDAVSTCGSVYEFANNFQTIFGGSTSIIKNSIQDDKKLVVFPNPTTGVFLINTAEVYEKSNQLFIYNAVGKMVYNRVIRNEIETINISEFPAGIYYLISGSYRQKIVKI
jgi:chitinase